MAKALTLLFIIFRCCVSYLWHNELPPAYWLNTTRICPVSFSVGQEVGVVLALDLMGPNQHVVRAGSVEKA